MGVTNNENSFFYCWLKNSYGHPPSLLISYELLEAPESLNFQYQKYLLSALDSDLQEISHCDLVLKKIAQIKTGEIEEYTDGGDGFYHYIKPNSVTFEHYVFNECPEWPLWSCSLAQYKAALEGWRKFLEMPVSIDSEVIVALPEDDSSHFPKS